MYSSKNNLTYICLEPLREGHASYTHVIEIINNLKLLGWNIELHYPEHSNQINLPHPAKRLANILKTIIICVLKLEKTNKVYIRWHPLSFFIHLYCYLKKIQVFQEVNGPYQDLFIAWPSLRIFKPIFIYMMRKQLCWAHHIFAVTEGLVGFCKIQSGHDRVSLITNGTNTNHFKPGRKLSFNLPNKYVVFFGTFSKWHGIEFILQASNHTLWPKEVKIVFAGDGEMKWKIESASKNSSNIIYLGRLPYETIPEIVSNALLSLIPIENINNRADTSVCPLKLLESLSCGTPVIVSNLESLSNFVKAHSCGLVIEPFKPEKLAQLVMDFHQNPQLLRTMGEKGRDVVLASYTWKRKAEEISEIINSSKT